MAAKSDVSCLHRGISRLQAEQLLVLSKHDGSYLIRESETISGAYTLCILVESHVHQYRILPDENGMLSVQSEAGVKNRKFNDLSQLIQQYAQRGDKNGLVCPLLYPVTAQHDDDDNDDEEEGETVEEVDNLNYEIMPPSADESEYALNGGHSGFDDFVARHFMQRFSQLNLSSCDGQFIDNLRRYVQEGAVKDASIAVADGKDMISLRKIIDNVATDLDKHVENLMVKIDLCRQLFGPITTAPLARADKTATVKADLNDIFDRISRCKKAVVNLERKAEIKFRDLSSMWKETTKAENTECQPRGSQSKPVIPPISFEAKTISLSSQSKIKLTVDIQAGKLMAIKPTKNVLNDSNVFTHDKIEQLIKSSTCKTRLDVKIAGRKKKTYSFDDVRQRENFCQLVQQLKNMHSLDPQVNRVSIFVGTWNMASEMPSYNLLPWLKSDGLGKKRNSILGMLPHDIYVIGTQESSVSEKDWVTKFRSLLMENFCEEFCLLTSASLWSIRVIVLVKQEHRNKISHVQQSSVKTGIANALGNKGAAGVSFMFNGTSFCFICCHLTSGHEKLLRRNQNIRDILKGISLGSKKLSFCDASNHFHHLFVFGDLNYRLDELDSVDIIQKVKHSDNYSSLLEYDQLRRQQRSKEAFVGFDEEEITFPPTYRFQKWTRDRYVWEKFKATGKRINAPSWCDRVLWRSYPHTFISNTSYGCIDSICSSDHKPVFSSFDVAVVTQFTSPHGGSVGNSDMSIVFEEICVEVKSTRQENYFVEFHSSCLESPVLSKQNILFEGRKDGYYCPKWTSTQLPQLQPIFGEWDYLEDQHLLLAVKTADGLESYGECVLALKSAYAAQSQLFQTILTHVGEETGSLRALMHVKAGNSAAAGQRRSRKAYELIYMDTDLLDLTTDNTNTAGAGMIYDEVTVDATGQSVQLVSTTLTPNSKPDAMPSTLPRPLTPQPVKQMSGPQSDVMKQVSVPDDKSSLEPSLPPRNYTPAVPPRKSRGPGVDDTMTRSWSPPRKADPAPKPPVATFQRTNRVSVDSAFVNQTYDCPQVKAHTPLTRLHSDERRNSPTPPPLPLPRRTLTDTGTTGSGAATAMTSSTSAMAGISTVSATTGTTTDVTVYNEASSRKPSSVKEWLDGLGVGRYVNDFMNNGWDHINFVCDMTDDDLQEIGVTDSDHRQKILRSITQLLSC